MRWFLPVLLLARAGLAQEHTPPPDEAWKEAYAPYDDSWKEAKQELIFIAGGEPETLDPHPMTGVTEHTFALALYEGLVTHDPETLEPRPGVAKRWEVSDDGLTYTFRLRDDAKWSNGDPVTAEDFRWSFFRAHLPGTQTDYIYLFTNYIAGCREFQALLGGGLAESDPEEQYAAFRKTAGVEVADPRTLRITLRAPCAYFLDLCAFETYMPVHRATVEAHGAAWTRPGNWVGNGPYVLAEWSPRARIVMTPNRHYWDADFVKLQKLTGIPLENDEQIYNKFVNGEVHWIRSIPVTRIEEAKRRPEYFVMPYLGSYFYRVNVTDPPLKDVRVRKALSMAVNREVITRDVTKAGEMPATWFVPPVAGYEPVKGLPYDPDAARKLLAEAGYPDGKGFPTLDLLYNTHESHKIIAEHLVQMWREVLGITVSLRNMEWNAYLKEVEALNYDLARAGWIGDYSDPNTFLDLFLTGGGNNNTGWGSARYDELVHQAIREPDPAKRHALYQEAERILVEEEFPIIPIYIYVNKGMKVESLQGWYPNVRDLHPFQFMYFEPD